MKNLLFVSILVTILYGCDINDHDNSRIQPFGAAKIESISITGNQINVTTVYGTPTPCWHFYRNEVSNNGNVFTSKVYGKDDSEMCIQVLGSFTCEEKIVFLTNGVKTLRFWQNDSTFLDTVITLQ